VNILSPFIGAHQVRRGFARAAVVYDSVAVLQRKIAERMLERLDCMKIDPKLLVDLGCGTGSGLTALGARYPQAAIVGIDACEAMLRAGNTPAPRLTADACALPLKPGVAGLVWSNLMWHWLADPVSGLREAWRILETGGLLMFSAFGPDTLKELRHRLRLIDMHDYGDMLVECGFADPVMEVERLTMTYPSPEALFGELRQNGCRRALLGKQKACERRRVDGRLPVTFEVIYGHAWKPWPKTIEDGRAVIRFAA
jgi:malonyl-CoA O-methyltransferase